MFGKSPGKSSDAERLGRVMSSVNQVDPEFFRQTERGVRPFACDKCIHTFTLHFY